MKGTLGLLASLAVEVEDATARLRAAVIDAVREGIPKTHIQEATGVARTTINRWIEEDETA